VIVLDVIGAFARFLYKFLVGDDLLVAVVMLAALALSGVLVRARIDAWWLVPPAAVLMTAVSLRRRDGQTVGRRK